MLVKYVRQVAYACRFKHIDFFKKLHIGTIFSSCHIQIRNVDMLVFSQENSAFPLIP